MFIHHFWDFLSSHFLMAGLAVGFATPQKGSGFIICLDEPSRAASFHYFDSLHARVPPTLCRLLSSFSTFWQSSTNFELFCWNLQFWCRSISQVSLLFMSFAQCFIAVISYCNTIASLSIGITIFVIVLGSGSYSFLNLYSPLLKDLFSNHL